MIITDEQKSDIAPNMEEEGSTGEKPQSEIDSTMSKHAINEKDLDVNKEMPDELKEGKEELPVAEGLGETKPINDEQVETMDTQWEGQFYY